LDKFLKLEWSELLLKLDEPETKERRAEAKERRAKAKERREKAKEQPMDQWSR
jgi:hypothetical protein